MEEKLNFESAYAELRKIASEIESEAVSVDIFGYSGDVDPLFR